MPHPTCQLGWERVGICPFSISPPICQRWVGYWCTLPYISPTFYVVSEPDPWKIKKEGLVNGVGWKCTLQNQKCACIPGTVYTSTPADLPDPPFNFLRVWFQDYLLCGGCLCTHSFLAGLQQRPCRTWNYVTRYSDQESVSYLQISLHVLFED